MLSLCDRGRETIALEGNEPRETMVRNPLMVMLRPSCSGARLSTIVDGADLPATCSVWLKTRNRR